MKKIVALCFFVMVGTYVFAQQGSLELRIKNIKGLNGTIRVGLFKTEKDFLINPVVGKVLKVTGPEMTVLFEDLPAGEYGVSIIHDANENEKLDTNTMGIPTEGFGFGNNAKKNFGPPSFKASIVTIGDKPVSQTINLKYFY